MCGNATEILRRAHNTEAKKAHTSQDDKPKEAKIACTSDDDKMKESKNASTCNDKF